MRRVAIPDRRFAQRRSSSRPAEVFGARRVQALRMSAEIGGSLDAPNKELFGNRLEAVSAWSRYRCSVHDFAGKTQACRRKWKVCGTGFKRRRVGHFGMIL